MVENIIQVKLLKLKIVLFLLFVSLASFGYGLTANITEFDDGFIRGNVTSNTTKYLTILNNVTIKQANITLKGFRYNFTETYCYQESANVSTSCGGLSSGKYSVQNISTIGYLFINYSKPNESIYGTRWQIKHGTYDTYNITIPSGCWNYDDRKLILRVKASVSGASDSRPQCFNGTWINLGSLDTGDTVGSRQSGDVRNYMYDGDWNTGAAFEYFQEWNNMISGDRLKARLMEEAIVWKLGTYPKNIFIRVNNTVIFNHTANLTGTNRSINLNKNSVLQSCYLKNNRCRIDFSANFGKLAVSDLFVQYNKSNFAVLNILTPNQILQALSVGDSFTQRNINIFNSGNNNATNISFVSVSSLGTPNLNDSMSWVCSGSSIQNSTSILCNVTFSNLQISPESDEKLKVRGLNKDSGSVIFSEGIDLDISVSESVSGGGGGRYSASESKWLIRIPGNRIINNIYGAFGYSTNPIPIQVYNNQTSTLNFNFRTEGIKCRFENNDFDVEGFSFGNNRVSCDYPQVSDSGKIIVSAGGYSQSINVFLASNDIGYLSILLSGRSKEYGLLFPFVFVAIVLGSVYYFIIRGG